VRAIVIKIYGLLSIALVALALHGAASAAVEAPHHGSPVVTNAGVMHTPEFDGCCDKGTCCDPSHCNMCLAVERLGFERTDGAMLGAAPITVPSGITIRPPLSPPRDRV
jgi:hypothetical protein